MIQNKDDPDDEFTDEALSAKGLMKAIRRVLESIHILSEQQPHLYQEIEEILKDSLLLCFSEEG